MDSRVLDEARAKIFWGEAPGEVQRFLLSQDCSRLEADRAIAVFLSERHREIRRTGFRKALIGAVLLAVSLCGLVAFWNLVQDPALRQRGGGYVFALLLVGLFFGIGKLADGVIYLLRPQLESKSISDLSY